MRNRVMTIGPALLVASLMAAVLLTGQAIPAVRGATSYDAARTYVRPSDFDFNTLLGDPPAKDSPEHAAEISTLLAWQSRRTAEQVSRCRREARAVNVWLFADVLGDDFNASTHPLTAALFDEVHANTDTVVFAAKRHWKRPRPAVENSSIQPCVHPERSASFPSGHAADGVVYALILAEIFPEQKDALLARGNLVGTDRVIAGIHFPSDVAAGQKLGGEIARRLLDNQDFQYELQRVEEECHSGTAAAGNQPATRPAEAATQP